MFKITKVTFIILGLVSIISLENNYVAGMGLPEPFHVPVPLITNINGKLSVYLTFIKNNGSPLILERYDEAPEKNENISSGENKKNKLIGFLNHELAYSATYALRKEGGTILYLLSIFYDKYSAQVYATLQKPGDAQFQQANILIPFMLAWGRKGWANISLTIGSSLENSAIGITAKEAI